MCVVCVVSLCVCVCVCVRGAVREGVTFQLCLMPWLLLERVHLLRRGRRAYQEWAGASRRDNNSVQGKIEISGGGSAGVLQLLHVKDPPQHTHTHTHPPPKPPPPHSSRILTLQHGPPIWQDFHPKAPRLMLFSVADMIQCGAVCNCLYREPATIAGSVKPIIKSVIPIIHSHAALTSSEWRRQRDQTARRSVRGEVGEWGIPSSERGVPGTFREPPREPINHFYHQPPPPPPPPLLPQTWRDHRCM